MTANLYRGFSTIVTRGPEQSVHDILLVNQDLLNTFNTPIGSRVGRGQWGSIIPLLLFDLGDAGTSSLIDADITRNVNADPRVSLVMKTVNVDLDQHSVLVRLLLDYVELSARDWASFPIQLMG